MKVAIYSRELEDELFPHFIELLNELQLHKATVCLHEALYNNQLLPDSKRNNLYCFYNPGELDETYDCLISLGGDGTMLDAAVIVNKKPIPILGINFGRLGFLATSGKEDIRQVVDALVHQKYQVDKRALVHIEASTPIFGENRFGLNELVIHKTDNTSMIKVHTYLNGEFMNTYWADGIIVSTPTGSTGYNLSCNGPIIFPQSGVFVITPIAPHHLNVRPIVVSDQNIISFKVEGRGEKFLCTLDARRETVDMDIEIAVRKESFNIGMIRLYETSFLTALRNKLGWGVDKRN